jgi:multidrug efflux pump subunit AcrA (membrane-fusion protein)
VLKINELNYLWIIPCVALPLLAGCGKSGGPQAPPPPQVSVAQVLVKQVKDWDEFTGRLQAVETVEIRPRVSGYIDKVAFTEGSLVKRGTLLFVIDPRPYQAEYDRAAADLKRAKTALDLGRIELTRVQRLKDSGAVSQEELDQRKSAVAQTEADVAGAGAALEAASLNLNFTKVTSPIDGRVSRAEVTRGNLVTGGSNGGTLLSSVVSMDPIYLYFDADEQSYLRYAQMARSGEYSAVLIDDRAVNTDQSQKYVLLLGANDQIEYRKVKLGRVIGGLRVVREGLKAGDVIVVNGAQRVHPGVTVAPQRVTMGADGAAAPAAAN